MADHSRRRQKSPPSAAYIALRPAPSSSINGPRPPEQADIFFKGLRGRNKGALEGHTLPHHPQNYIRLLGGSSSINLTRRQSVRGQCLVWGIRGGISAAVAKVVAVFCSVPEHEPLFWLNQGTVGITRKLLSRARQFLRCTEAET
jgi:hypothetical protein